MTKKPKTEHQHCEGCHWEGENTELAVEDYCCSKLHGTGKVTESKPEVCSCPKGCFPYHKVSTEGWQSVEANVPAPIDPTATRPPKLHYLRRGQMLFVKIADDTYALEVPEVSTDTPKAETPFRIGGFPTFDAFLEFHQPASTQRIMAKMKLQFDAEWDMEAFAKELSQLIQEEVAGLAALSAPDRSSGSDAPDATPTPSDITAGDSVSAVRSSDPISASSGTMQESRQPATLRELDIDLLLRYARDNQVDMRPAFERKLKELVEQEANKRLERLVAEHDATCGATFPKEERDNCNFRSIVIAELNHQSKGEL